MTEEEKKKKFKTYFEKVQKEHDEFVKLYPSLAEDISDNLSFERYQNFFKILQGISYNKEKFEQSWRFFSDELEWEPEDDMSYARWLFREGFEAGLSAVDDTFYTGS